MRGNGFQSFNLSFAISPTVNVGDADAPALQSRAIKTVCVLDRIQT